MYLMVHADCVPEAKEELGCRRCSLFLICDGPIKMLEVEE